MKLDIEKYIDKSRLERSNDLSFSSGTLKILPTLKLKENGSVASVES